MNRIAIRKFRFFITTHNHIHKDFCKNIRYLSNTGKDTKDNGVGDTSNKDESNKIFGKLLGNEGVTKSATEQDDSKLQRNLSQYCNQLEKISNIDLENSSNVMNDEKELTQKNSNNKDIDQKTDSDIKRDEREKDFKFCTESSINKPKETEHTPSENILLHPHTVVESIGSAVNATKQQAVNYSHEINKVYSEIEHDMMKRINESNQRRFRLFLLSSTLIILWIGVVFGSKIRKMLSDQTAGLAKETLENESLKLQTQELAMAVVQTVLNDKEVTYYNY